MTMIWAAISLNAGFRHTYVWVAHMKHCFKIRRQHITVSIILFVTMLSLFSAGASAGDDQTGPGDELISLNSQNEPLKVALERISTATGYEFDVDDRWQGYPVTASLEAVSLHRGLKSILKNTNNVIVYGPGRKIKITIYDKTKPGKISDRPSKDRSFDRSPEPRRRADRAVMEKEDRERNREIPSERDDESVEEPETGTSDETVASDNEEEKAEPEKPERVNGEAENADAEDSSPEENPEKETRAD